MEIASSAEKLAQDWKLKIRDWNLHAALPANTEIADGKVVLPRNSQGFHDHGTNFGVLGEQKFRMAITDVKKAHKDANLLAVFPTENGDIVWYEFKHEMKGVDAQGRGGVYSASAYFLFNSGEGQKFVNQVQEEPSLADALVASKFPIFKQEVKVQDWNEILYLPQDLFFKTMEEQIKVINKKQDKEEYSQEFLATTLKNLEGTFRILREQTVLQSGSLYIGVDPSRRDQTAHEVIDAYVAHLKQNREAEIRNFFQTPERYDETLNSLTNEKTKQVLLSFYKVDEDKPWRELEGRIASFQGYKRDNFPSKDDVSDSQRWLLEHKKNKTQLG